MLQVEHIAWQVQDPPAVAKWYIENLGFKVVRKMDAAPFMHFISDASGRVIIEIYNNPAASVPDYPKLSPLHLHLAFAAENLDEERDRLLKAGASIAENMIVTPTGDKLIMLRDPWGFPVQLCKRVTKMIG